MGKPMMFCAITANCGNDVIGQEASEKIAELTQKRKLDFVVINCQEVNFAKTKKQLDKALGENSGYSVTLLGKMSTHTKPLEQLHRNTGLASFVIHKNELSIDVSDRVKARRDVSRFSGSGFNKGGLITNFTVTSSRKGSVPLKLQTVSGHLDSSDTAKRAKDWANLHQCIGKKNVETWSELVKAMPNIRIAGYDANTRNQFIKDASPVRIWESTPAPQELQAFQQAPLGGVHFSRDSTYKTSDSNITNVEDPKRPGYVRGGMLDFVDIAADVENRSSSSITTEDVGFVGSGRDSKRDHDVIISPLQQYDQKGMSEFERVKNQMITQLRICAPSVVDRMSKYNANDKDKLLKIYNEYLSKDGLVNKQIELQADLLGNINKIKKIDGNLGEKIAQLLLTDKAWFSSSSKEMQTKRELSAVLSACKTESDLMVVQNAIDDSGKTTSDLKRDLQQIMDNYKNQLLSDVHQRCMNRVDDLISKINAIPSDPHHPELRACIIIQAALELTGDLYNELRLMKKMNVPGSDGARSAILGMIKQVKDVVIKLFTLFVKENSLSNESEQSKQVERSVQQLNLNMPSWLDRLRLNRNDSMVSNDFSKMKTKAEQQKLNALDMDDPSSNHIEPSELTSRRSKDF